ncbi:MAG TPA: aspartate 1-decarboxylase [Chloroflexia bacterium]|nr:aspartate 1-decarboxylase [Chloroflexia bacterium]
MLRPMCKAKLHGVTVTEANLQYVGSITIDQNLLDAADLLPFEWLHVANVATGDRFETYAIAGERGSGIIGLNGATARLGASGDTLIIMSYAYFSPDELRTFQPRLVFVDAANQPLHLAATEAARQSFCVSDPDATSSGGAGG